MPKNRLLFLLVLIIAGLLIVFLPDSDDRLISLSADHGPSLQDTIGLALILCPYLYLSVLAWKKKEKIKKFQDTKLFKFGLFVAGLGLGLVIASVLNNYSYWWAFGAFFMLTIQIPVFYITLK